MPPIFDKPTTDKYDYVVIGGGSGGSGSSVSNCGLSYTSDTHPASFFHREEPPPMVRKLLW